MFNRETRRNKLTNHILWLGLMFWKMHGRKSYFAMPNEALTPDCSSVNYTVTVCAALYSLRRGSNNVVIAQTYLANMCGFDTKTIRECIKRLIACGIILDQIENRDNKLAHHKNTFTYVLKPLPESGFFFCPRAIFADKLKAADFAEQLFMCRAQSTEYGKSWNSYNDLCKNRGHRNRSRTMASIGKLVEPGLLKKTVRKAVVRAKAVFVDNIYRVSGLAKILVKRENRPATTGRNSNRKNDISIPPHSLPLFRRNVKYLNKENLFCFPEPPKFVQCRLDF
jgi:hypothetical protein